MPCAQHCKPSAQTESSGGGYKQYQETDSQLFVIIAKHKERHKRQRLNYNQNNVQLKQQRQHKQQRHQQPKNEQNRLHSLAEIGNQQRREHQRRVKKPTAYCFLPLEIYTRQHVL